MAATVSKVTPGSATPGSATPRKNRVARVTAKRPKREPEEQRDPDERELETEEEVVEKPSRPDSGTYLPMYFRDIAELDLLLPEAEFSSARDLEPFELMLWGA